MSGFGQEKYLEDIEGLLAGSFALENEISKPKNGCSG